MTQVSQYGLEMLNGDDIQLEVESDISDDENRENEIKKVLQDLPEETFDYDSEDSLAESRSSSVNLNNNNGSFLSNKDTSQVHMNGKANEFNNNSILSDVNLFMLPNAVTHGTEKLSFPAQSNITTNYRSSVSPGVPTPVNGFGRVNGNHVFGESDGNTNVPNTAKPKKHVTIVESVQKNREAEEINVSNPTISLLHKDHCPRNENGTHVSKDMWLASENKEEQMKTLLEIRERQIHRGEEEIGKLQKDKRSLNHQIGLMKTEMVQMRSQQDEAEKFARLKEQECEYLKTKLREAIEEYEKARQGERTSQNEISQLNSEVGKLQQEVQLLSSIGSSAHQAEVNDVVRQLREKHATDYVAWKKVVTELEGQLRTSKRQQQLMLDESFVDSKVHASSQTDVTGHDSYPKSPRANEVKRKDKTEIAFIKDGDDGDVLIKERKIISLNEKFEELKKEFEEEKEELVDAYEKEIEEYRRRLATLPNELYRMWEKTQKELGLQTAFESKPICVDAFTSPADFAEISDDEEANLKYQTRFLPASNSQDIAVQVNFASVMANRDNELKTDKNVNCSPRDVSSILVQTEDKETSNAVIQTDETLETYKILAQLLESWSNEVQMAKANVEEMTLKCRTSEDELNKFRKQFKLLQKVATKCRKESKKREDALKKQISEMTARHLEVLQKLDEKLDVLA